MHQRGRVSTHTQTLCIHSLRVWTHFPSSGWTHFRNSLPPSVKRQNVIKWKLFLLFAGVESLSNDYAAVMPKEEDLHGAALALIRLQDTYNLNMTDMAAGSILDSPASVQMTGESIVSKQCAQQCWFSGTRSLGSLFKRKWLQEETTIPQCVASVQYSQLKMSFQNSRALLINSETILLIRWWCTF